VEQLTLTSVRVSWAGTLEEAECADNILVKHYKGIHTGTYGLSDPPLDTSVTSYIVYDLTPEVEYTYQVIAREEKGLLGVDYNRGEKTTFTTSHYNREHGLEVRQEDLLPHEGVVPVYSEAQRTRTLVAGLPVELLMGAIVVILVIGIVSVGVIYNCVRMKRPKTDIELDSSIYEEDDGEEGDEEEEEDEVDEFESNCNETKKYDMMAAINRKESAQNQIMRPNSVA